MGNNRNLNRNVAYYGVFVAVALLVGYVEMLIPMPVFIAGMKLGLSNVVIVIILYLYGFKSAVGISALKVTMSSLLFSGFGSFAYSLCGGLLSVLIMWLAKSSKIFSIVAVSVMGGIAHNMGQLIVATIIIENINLMYYGFLLLIFGVISGCCVGAVANGVIARLGAIGFVDSIER